MLAWCLWSIYELEPFFQAKSIIYHQLLSGDVSIAPPVVFATPSQVSTIDCIFVNVSKAEVESVPLHIRSVSSTKANPHSSSGRWDMGVKKKEDKFSLYNTSNIFELIMVHTDGPLPFPCPSPIGNAICPSSLPPKLRTDSPKAVRMYDLQCCIV